MTERRAFAGLGALAVLAWLLVPTYPNYDSYYALVWGRELLDGLKPSFEAYAAPTEHPLWVGWSALLRLVCGGAADRALVLTCVLAFVALVWATYRVGRACFTPLSGIVAALCVGSSFAFLLYAARAYVDIPYLALVVWAGALEAERPRRGAGPMALLALAGLLRPEAWILAGAYWLWCAYPERRLLPGLLALVLVAPVSWALVDLAVTGDALFSLHSTSDLARALGRERGLQHVPRSLVSFLADTARPPVFLAALGGLWLAWRTRAELRAPHVPLALLGGGMLAFVGSGAVGLSLLPRYLTVPAVALCLYAGFAVGGFQRLPAGRMRELWTRGAIAAAVLGALFLLVRIPSFTRLADELRFIHRTHVDVAATAQDPLVTAARRCGPITLPTYRLVPDLRYELHAGPDAIVSRADAPADRGVALVLVGDKPVRRFGKADGVPRGTNVAPPGFAPVARHGMLAAYGACSPSLRRTATKTSS